MPTDIPADLDAAVDRVDQLEEAAAMAAAGEELRMLERDHKLIAERLGGGPRATLTMPLVRLVDADGSETVLAEAVVEVELVPAEVLNYLDQGADALVGGEPLVYYISRRVTDEGAVAIRALATLLDGQK
jgi:hypothetical protein